MRHLSDIKPGQVIGRYEFLAPIAQGGMAAVWAARQRGSRGFSKVVAIKTMLPSISEDPRFERMFLDEAQIASRIRHGNVVEILDLGEESEILYLVMEWVDGESLSVVRRRAALKGGIPQRLSVRIVADACAGLHAAHELSDDEGAVIGLVHRDVSPQNILVGYDGVVKVLDFGVAKIAGRTTDTTSIGHARGKPPYMAPEQALGKVVDRRADIFSLGIIFYQLLVGRHPFRGENDIATLHNIISEQVVPSPREVDPTISDSIEAVALRAIDRDPERRFQTAQEFELALESLLDDRLGRVRVEELARFMTETMGATQEERRNAIREAIRMADSAEPTRLDVSVVPPSSPSANAGDALADVSNAPYLVSSPTDHSSNAFGVRSDVGSSEGLDTSVASTEPFEPKAKGSGKRGSMWTARGAWQILLAMLVGAALAWVGSALIAKPMSSVRRVPTMSGSSSANVLPMQSASPPREEQMPASTLPPGEARDPRRAMTRRSFSVGNKAGTGGGTHRQTALPPIPSPGF